MTASEKKALRERLARRTKAEMSALERDPEFRREHAVWEKEYRAAAVLHAARQKAGLTQVDLAARMNTRRSNVSRMENGQNVTFATFTRYLLGCGYDFRITVFPARTGAGRPSAATANDRVLAPA